MISILMSTHNPIEKYFVKSLNCIFNQKDVDFELVLVDDGSSISIQDILKKYNYDLKKVKLIRLDNNVGLPRALNIGLKRCEGEFIARMDDDDLMSSMRLKKQLNYVKENNLDGCFCWFETINKDDKIINRNTITLSNNKYLSQLINKGNIFCHSSLFVKKSVLQSINGYDENLKYAQDSDIYIRILNRYRMGMVNDYLVQHRVNEFRNSKYRETLSLTYALFGAMNYYTSNDNLKLCQKILIFGRLLRYYREIINISRKKGEK